MFQVPEKYRIKTGPQASDRSFGNNGAFWIQLSKYFHALAIASDGAGWEHVSVSIRTESGTRMPTWTEMCYIKNLFWSDEDTVVQYHPPKSDYVNMHPHVLHIWRPVGIEIPRPPSILVGVK